MNIARLEQLHTAMKKIEGLTEEIDQVLESVRKPAAATRTKKKRKYTRRAKAAKVIKFPVKRKRRMTAKYRAAIKRNLALAQAARAKKRAAGK